ncbi:MAG: ATP-binding protein [Pseudomonadota bacterium]
MSAADWQFLTSAYYEQLLLERQRELLFNALPLWATVLNLVAALILFAVWRRHRNISHFDWLIGVSLTGIGYSLNGPYAGLLAPFVGDTLLAAWLYFLSRVLYNYPSPVGQRWLGALPLLAMLLYGVAEMLDSPDLQATVTGFYCLCLWWMSMHQVGLRLQRPLTSKLSLVLAVWLIGLLGVIDSLIVVTDYRLPAHPDQVLQLVPIGQIIGVFAALYFLVSRHAENQRQLLMLHESLDERVQAAEAELEDRYRLLTRDALDAAAMRERKSIYESIHEDLSDKLLQLIYAARVPETADLARSALAELRDSRRLTPDQDRPLVEILADVRAEMQTRCEQAGLTLHWQENEAVGELRLQARQESALTRTLREALSNLLKHAQASEVWVGFSLAESGAVEYTVADNGRGIAVDHRTGRGLVNMRNRMQELGGGVEIGVRPEGGTQLCFLLPNCLLSNGLLSNGQLPTTQEAT